VPVKGPLIITTDMVEKMRPSSVIVDIAAENGGNCELTNLVRLLSIKEL
jgi:NAD(P) transhydrogenase subunit alpha